MDAGPLCALVSRRDEGEMREPVHLLSDAEIRDLLVQRIDRQAQSVGIVVGIVGAAGRRIVSYGRLSRDDDRQPDESSIFHLGSIGKVFTALLLAEMARKGEVALDDPVAKFLPETVRMPQRGGREITLQNLATHTSGLPRLPSNFEIVDRANPYAPYTVDQLYQFLSHHELTRDIGSQYEYSNLGAGLLGHALSLRAGKDYETLVRTRICDPLGMDSTRVTLSPELKARCATGHNLAREPIPMWDLPPAFAGAGSLWSPVHDLLTFLTANLGLMASPLSAAIAAMHDVRLSTGLPGTDVALGWHLTTRDGHEIIWHNGGSDAFRSFAGYEPRSGVGVAVLSNMGNEAGVDDIGMHLLNPNYPLYKPPAKRTAIAVDPALFDAYVGHYELAPNFIVTVSQEGDRLYLKSSVDPKYEIFPESTRDFFLEVTDAQITFVVDNGGRATGLIVHRNGIDTPARRID